MASATAPSSRCATRRGPRSRGLLPPVTIGRLLFCVRLCVTRVRRRGGCWRDQVASAVGGAAGGCVVDLRQGGAVPGYVGGGKTGGQSGMPSECGCIECLIEGRTCPSGQAACTTLDGLVGSPPGGSGGYLRGDSRGTQRKNKGTNGRSLWYPRVAGCGPRRYGARGYPIRLWAAHRANRSTTKWDAGGLEGVLSCTGVLSCYLRAVWCGGE